MRTIQLNCIVAFWVNRMIEAFSTNNIQFNTDIWQHQLNISHRQYNISHNYKSSSWRAQRTKVNRNATQVGESHGGIKKQMSFQFNLTVQRTFRVTQMHLKSIRGSGRSRIRGDLWSWFSSGDWQRPFTCCRWSQMSVPNSTWRRHPLKLTVSVSECNGSKYFLLSVLNSAARSI